MMRRVGIGHREESSLKRWAGSSASVIAIAADADTWQCVHFISQVLGLMMTFVGVVTG